MKAATFRRLAPEKVMAVALAECGTVDTSALAMKKIDYYHKRASKLSEVWRQGRRNFMYSK